ncbi:hypothetical protein QOT17_000554 [Balamuthia mandrillaris]
MKAQLLAFICGALLIASCQGLDVSVLAGSFETGCEAGRDSFWVKDVVTFNKDGSYEYNTDYFEDAVCSRLAMRHHVEGHWEIGAASVLIAGAFDLNLPQSFESLTATSSYGREYLASLDCFWATMTFELGLEEDVSSIECEELTLKKRCAVGWLQTIKFSSDEDHFELGAKEEVCSSRAATLALSFTRTPLSGTLAGSPGTAINFDLRQFIKAADLS